jgi:uncharacterized SAM-binding protein YcdF (DUF218 family)
VTYIQPLLFFFLAICVVGVLQSRWRLVIVGVAATFLISWHPVAWLLSRPLELWFPPATIDGRLAQAIVVPGSDYDDPTPERPFPVADRDTYGRCLMAAWLYHKGPHVPVLVSGHWATRLMRGILESEGVPAASIWEETSAHSTHENAVFSAKVLREHHLTTIVVMSEARSMLRVKKSFEREGLSVIPAVWTRLEFTQDVRHLLPGWMALQSNENTLHEVVGLMWYWVRGWI